MSFMPTYESLVTPIIIEEVVWPPLLAFVPYDEAEGKGEEKS